MSADAKSMTGIERRGPRFFSPPAAGCVGFGVMNLQAVIFDFDGIIVDSEPLHHQAFCQVLEPLNLPLSWGRYYEHYLGFDDRDVLRARFNEEGIHLEEAMMQKLMREKAEAFLHLIHAKGVKAYPGVVALVRALHRELPLAICSGALMGDIQPILRVLDIEDCFAIKVTADQVHVSKPDPESYVEAFRRLKEQFAGRVTEPSRCVAIEDTPAGIEAAQGAGLNVLAVQNTYEPEALARANRVVASLETIDALALNQLVVSP
jgi:beta-phosphoglucomutase